MAKHLTKEQFSNLHHGQKLIVTDDFAQCVVFVNSQMRRLSGRLVTFNGYHSPHDATTLIHIQEDGGDWVWDRFCFTECIPERKIKSPTQDDICSLLFS